MSEPAANASQAADPPPARRSRRPMMLFLLIALLAVIGGFIWWFLHRNQITTDDAFTDGDVVTVAPRVAGQIIALDVTDNQHVAAGQRLLKIDPADYLIAEQADEAKLQALHAQAIQAKASLAITNTTAPARLAEARAQLAEAKATAYRAGRDAARLDRVNPAATTREAIDAANAAKAEADAQVAAAEAQVRSASTVVDSIKQAEAQVRELQSQASQASADLAQARLNLAYTDLKAPQSGYIAQRNAVMGNYVKVGDAQFSIVTDKVWVTANFKENEITRIHPGQKVDIHVDAYPWLKLRGHIDSIQLGSGSKFSAFPAENATGNFVKIVQRVPVKIDIDSGLDPKLPLPLGISVEPTVFVK